MKSNVKNGSNHSEATAVNQKIELKFQHVSKLNVERIFKLYIYMFFIDIFYINAYITDKVALPSPTLSPKNTDARPAQTLFSRRITAEAARQLTVTEP